MFDVRPLELHTHPAQEEVDNRELVRILMGFASFMFKSHMLSSLFWIHKKSCIPSSLMTGLFNCEW